ncbi:MAG: histone deacetylase family protein [Marivibrio sp.]|uniref:histone deacetylase family protein n=1 Tax=Marivibrio sp. TaxID=2039719 RepID=UPI0032EF6315
MRIIYSDAHERHVPKLDLVNGELGAPAEGPFRAQAVLDGVREAGVGRIEAPQDWGREYLSRIHTAAYVDFLESAWDEWAAAYGADAADALPLARVQHDMRRDRIPRSIDGKLSYFSYDIGSPIGPGTWAAALKSAHCATTAADIVAGGERAAFSLGRPGGHHAGVDYYAGYCYLAIEALAAQHLLDRGAKKVAILDVDYHHGNGPQSIFYRRGDVFYGSIHGDPSDEYPFFTGYADETGEGEGEGATLNIPLPFGTGWRAYEPALAHLTEATRRFGADALVIAMGVDTHKDDPISRFRLEVDHYPRIGAAIASLRLPTVWINGGGYDAAALKAGVPAMLAGFEGA